MSLFVLVPLVRHSSIRMDLSKGVRKSSVINEAPADAPPPPVPGTNVTIAYQGSLPDGKVFDESPKGETLSFLLGDSSVTEGRQKLCPAAPVFLRSCNPEPHLMPPAPTGLNIAVSSMRVGERASFTFPPEAAWGSTGLPSKGVPPNTSVDFDVTLVAAAAPSATASLPPAAASSPALPSDYDPSKDAELLKEHGNNRLRAGDASGAFFKYRQALQFLDLPGPTTGPLADAVAYGAVLQPLRLTLFGNLAQAALSLGRLPEALEAADAVLAAAPNNEKALFRRAKALQGLQRVPEALAAVDSLLLLEPDNRAAHALRLQLAPPEAEAVEKETPCLPVAALPLAEGARDAPVPVGAPLLQPTPVPEAPSARPPKAVSEAPLAAAARKAFGSLYDDKPEVSPAALPATGSGSSYGLVASFLEPVLDTCAAVAAVLPFSWCGCGRAVRGLRARLGMAKGASGGSASTARDSLPAQRENKKRL